MKISIICFYSFFHWFANNPKKSYPNFEVNGKLTET
jgi:hypothetical protein